MMNPAMNNMNMMNMGNMGNIGTMYPGMNNMNMINSMNMGMSPMMNMNMMIPQRMINSGPITPVKIEDNEGWTLTFEKDGKETKIKISPDKTVLEAGNMFKLKANLAGDLKLKYKYGSKFLDNSLQLCQSGLIEDSKINVVVEA